MHFALNIRKLGHIHLQMHIRKSVISALFFAFAQNNLSGQGINIGAGASLTISGNPVIEINNGAIENSGTYSKESETVLLSGTSSAEITGSSNTTINNLTISNSGGITTRQNLLTISQSLQIDNSASLNTAPGKSLTVEGSIVNNAGNGGLNLESDATGTASLLHSTNNVSANAQLYMSGNTEAWHFLSSPVFNQSIGGSWTPAGTYGNGTGYDLYAWNEATSCWIYKLNTTTPTNWNTVHPNGNFDAARGYLYSVQAANPTKSFAGSLNNGIISYNITKSGAVDTLIGFNLSGNPYPSAIDWKIDNGWSRNNLVSNGGGYDVWVWNPAANNYGVFNSAAAEGSNGTNGVTQYIPAMQGFFVRASSAGTFSVNNNARLHHHTTRWKSATYEPNRFSVKVQSEEGRGSDEVILMFGAENNQTGARKLFSPVATAPSLYLPAEGKKASVRYLTNTKENPKAPLQFKAGIKGTYKLVADFDYSSYEWVSIEDKVARCAQDLKSNPEYVFTAQTGDNADRFVIHFEPRFSEGYRFIKIFVKDKSICVDLTHLDGESVITIYDTMGKCLVAEKAKGGSEKLYRIDQKNQIYMVNVRNTSALLNETKKVILEK